MKRAKRYLLVLVAMGAAAAGFRLWLGSGPDLDIQFRGYVKRSDGVIVANCQVKNLTWQHMVVLALPPQVRADGQWRESGVLIPPIPSKMFVPAGMAANIEFPLPNPPGTWRVGVVARNRRQETTEITIRRVLPRRVLPAILFGRSFYSAAIPPSSEPVPQEIGPDASANGNQPIPAAP